MIGRRYLWLEAPIYFLYYFFVSPFKFEYNRKSQSYALVTNVFQKVLVIVIQIFGILQTFMGLYTSTSKAYIENPSCIFHLGVLYSRNIIYYALIFTFLTRRAHFVSFFCPPSSPPSSSIGYPPSKPVPEENSQGYSRLTKYIAWLLCMLMIPVAVGLELLSYSGSPGFVEYVKHTFQSREGLRGVGSMFGWGNSSGFPLPGLLPAHGVPPPPDLTTWQFVITIIYDVVVIYVRVCNHIAVMFCILAGITLYQVVTGFVTSIVNERDQDKVILKYVDFCKFGSGLNKMCGWVVLGSVICSPPFYIVYLIGVFSNVESSGPRVIFYSCLYCVLYIIAAEGASKIAEFKEWIAEFGEGDNESQLFAIFVEISQNPMGLRGMNCFTITYGFISKMFATIITFTIILLQFETTPKSAMTNSRCQE